MCYIDCIGLFVKLIRNNILLSGVCDVVLFCSLRILGLFNFLVSFIFFLVLTK